MSERRGNQDNNESSTRSEPETPSGAVGLVIHRSGRGFFGNVHTWNSFFKSSSTGSPGDGANNDSSKHYRLSKTFALFHLFRNPFIWHFWIPISLFVAAMVVQATVDEIPVLSMSYLPNNNTSTTTSNGTSSTTAAGGPFWSAAATSAVLCMFALLSATVVPRIVSPLLFSERGHRSDLSLPIDIVASRRRFDSRVMGNADEGGDNNNGELVSSSPAAASSSEQQLRSTSSFSSVMSSSNRSNARGTAFALTGSSSSPTSSDASSTHLFSSAAAVTIHNHVPFRRVPMTPKAVGFWVAIVAQPIVNFILLFSNSVVSVMKSNNVAAEDDSFYSSVWWSPFGVVAGWITFDFTRHVDDAAVGCALGRFWFWFVLSVSFVLFYPVLIGVMWSSVQAEMQKLGKQFTKTFRWCVLWSVALASFPLWYRQLFTAFGCRWQKQVAALGGNSSLVVSNNVTTTSTTSTTVPQEPQHNNETLPTIRALELRSVTNTCSSTACGSYTHFAYAKTALVFVFVSFPFLLVIHTQLRRLSGVPRLGPGQKVSPLPRIDGLHLYMWILSRFTLAAMSGVSASSASLAICSLVLDILAVFFTWRSPCVSNVAVINWWWQRWTVPACLVSSVGYALWVATVFSNISSSSSSTMTTRKNNNDDAVLKLSVVEECGTVLVLVVLFISAYVSHKNEARNVNARRSVNGAGGDLGTFAASVFHLPNFGEPLKSQMSNSPRRSSSPLNNGTQPHSNNSSSDNAIGGAVESSYSPRSASYRSSNNDDDDIDDKTKERKKGGDGGGVTVRQQGECASPLSPHSDASRAGGSGFDDDNHSSNHNTPRPVHNSEDEDEDEDEHHHRQEISLFDEPDALFEKDKSVMDNVIDTSSMFSDVTF